MRRPVRILLTSLLIAAPVHGQTAAETDRPGDGAAAVLLDVPYVPQTEDLCGGAALAMVRRYWGDPSATAGDFAGYLDPVGGGISVTRLAEAARSTGWIAVPQVDAGPDAPVLMSQLTRGRPVIALIEDRPGVFHYVVVVGATGSEVVVHDSARRPFETFARAEFDRRWSRSERWMLLVLPRAIGPSSSGGDVAAPEGGAAMDPGSTSVVDRAIALAATGRLTEAAGILEEAARETPRDPQTWRELAGVRFLQKQWADAERIARVSAELDPEEPDVWRLIGASRYMQGDGRGALESFNRVGEPLIDRVVADGTRLTPVPVVVALTGLQPRQLLTADGFDRAARRLGAWPAADRTALHYEPASGATMTVRASIVERPLMPSGWLPWVVAGSRALISDTLLLDIAGPARSGELWHAGWRWADHWRRIAFGLTLPTPGRLAGIVGVRAVWERRDFDVGGGGLTTENRRRTAVHFTDWASGALRWRVGFALDHFNGVGYGSLSGGVDRRWLGDRLSTEFAVEHWLGRHPPFSRSIGQLSFRSSVQPVPEFAAEAGVGFVTARAPMSVWPTAGVGGDHLAALRAHPRRDGLVSSNLMGRRMTFASLEAARPLPIRGTARAWWAAFIDLAAVAHRPTGRAAKLQADVGTGLRVRVPGLDGTIHLDVAYALHDLGWRLGASIRGEWPRR